jgi:DNA-binding response OmpR family regulator
MLQPNIKTNGGSELLASDLMKINSIIEFSYDGHFIIKKGQRIFLSITEFRLFVYFLRNKNKHVLIENLIDYMNRYSPSRLNKTCMFIYEGYEKKLKTTQASPRF